MQAEGAAAGTKTRTSLERLSSFPLFFLKIRLKPPLLVKSDIKNAKKND